MKIGILQAGHLAEEIAAKHGDYTALYSALLDGYGLTFETYSVVDNVFPESATSCDGWLITGSRHGAYEDHDWIAPLEQLVRDAYAARIPMVGLCFGHQIIAKALGGTVEKYKGGWSVGKTEYQVVGSDQTLSINAWHQDQVVAKPEGARVVAQTDFCKFAGLVYDTRVLSYQPHPEFGNDLFVDLVEIRGRGVVPDAIIDKAVEITKGDLSSGQVGNQLAEFLIENRVN
jgi:GMP synthase-like glutamine amidotransferase